MNIIALIIEPIYNFLLQCRLWYNTAIYPCHLINNVTIEKDGYTLLFNDEFDLGYIDTTKWELLPNWGCRVHPENPKCAINFDNIQFNNSSNLNLLSKKDLYILNDCDHTYNIEYTYALIENYKFSVQLDNSYGYYEIRCKIPKGVGMWPAFWLWGVDSWPPEIDVFEFWTTEKCNWFNSNYHWKKDDIHKQKPYTHRTPLMNLSDDFHRYGLLWDKNYIKFYFDGLLIRKIWVKDSSVMRVVIDSGVDVKKICDSDLPSDFEIDWFRYYTL